MKITYIGHSGFLAEFSISPDLGRSTIFFPLIPEDT